MCSGQVMEDKAYKNFKYPSKIYRWRQFHWEPNSDLESFGYGTIDSNSNFNTLSPCRKSTSWRAWPYQIYQMYQFELKTAINARMESMKKLIYAIELVSGTTLSLPDICQYMVAVKHFPSPHYRIKLHMYWMLEYGRFYRWAVS